jgi:hypothetical protein
MVARCSGCWISGSGKGPTANLRWPMRTFRSSAYPWLSLGFVFLHGAMIAALLYATWLDRRILPIWGMVLLAGVSLYMLFLLVFGGLLPFRGSTPEEAGYPRKQLWVLCALGIVVIGGLVTIWTARYLYPTSLLVALLYIVLMLILEIVEELVARYLSPPRRRNQAPGGFGV